MPSLLRGLLSGLLLSLLRAPLGIDLLQWPAVEARTSYGWRAAAIAAIAIGLWASRTSSLSILFLLSTALGYTIHALLLANLWSPSSPLALLATAAAGLALLAASGRLAPRTDPPPRPPFPEMLGLAVAACGLALSLEAIARHLRLLGAGLAQDDSTSAAVLLLELAAGAAAFGWIASSARLRGPSLPILLAAGASAGLVSMRVLERLSTGRGLATYIQTYGLDTSLHGTLRLDALLAASCFVLPAFLAGTALPGARSRDRILSIGVGAALGLALTPSLLALAPGATADDPQAASAELVPLGALLAAAGAALAVLSDAERGGLARWIGAAVALALALPALLARTLPLPILSPWLPRPVLPKLVSDIPEGQVTVEPSRAGLDAATLDRRWISPPAEGVAADAQRLAQSAAMLPAATRARGPLSVLLVGQLTPARASALAAAGATRIDRSAAWSAAMERVESVLFEGTPLPAGEILAPAEARRRLRAGAYDLAIAPPVPGDAPATVAIDAPEKTTVVRWMEADQPAQPRKLGAEVLLATDGFDRPCVGLVTNGSKPAPDDPSRPLVTPAGAPSRAPTPIAWLLARRTDRIDQRTDRARAAMLARLAAAGQGGPDADLLAGLALFYASQERSSGFETREERTELEDDVVERLQAAAMADAPSPLARRLFENVARVLVGKRWVEKVYRHVQPVAERHAPWPALEKALAQADLESLEPEAAIARLVPLSVRDPGDFEVWYLLGESRARSGEAQASRECWRRALWLPAADPGLKRKVVLALARAGDPEGLEAARQILLGSPEDREILEALKGTPPPGDGR